MARYEYESELDRHTVILEDLVNAQNELAALRREISEFLLTPSSDEKLKNFIRANFDKLQRRSFNVDGPGIVNGVILSENPEKHAFLCILQDGQIVGFSQRNSEDQFFSMRTVQEMSQLGILDADGPFGLITQDMVDAMLIALITPINEDTMKILTAVRAQAGLAVSTKKTPNES